MLVLARREYESIVIGNDIAITILRMGGGQVAVGVAAPKDIEVHRAEIYLKINGPQSFHTFLDPVERAIHREMQRRKRENG